MQQVIATKQGYDGLAVREPGEVFQMPDGATGTWFKPHGEVVPPDPDHDDKKPKGRRAKGEVVPPDPTAD